jgi:hypothetical protein
MRRDALIADQEESLILSEFFGKTTLSFHLATFLAREKRVLLIDVDHQSSLSIVVLGSALWEKCVKSDATVNRVFESFCNRKIPMPKMEIVNRNAIGGRNSRYKDFYPNLDFVSAQFELDDTEIDLASTNYYYISGGGAGRTRSLCCFNSAEDPGRGGTPSGYRYVRRPGRLDGTLGAYGP